MLKGVEVTAIETIALVEVIKKLMSDFKKNIREKLPKIYSQDLLNNQFRHPYTRIEFIMNELSVSRPTASSYLRQLESKRIVEKLRIGGGNFYLNEKLFTLLINAFHLEASKVDSVDSNSM